MTIRVIGAGFGRTGTLSLKTALEKLGYNKTHHMMKVMQDPKQWQHWQRIAGGTIPPWEEVFDGFEATTDFPACVYFESLAATYPDAKVVLSVRDEESWYRSMDATLLQVDQAMPRWLLAIAPPLKRIWDAVDTIVWQNTFAGKAYDPDHAKFTFRTHNDKVIAAIPADRLLVFEVKQGWEPLCQFLDKPIPHEPFPHVNDTAKVQRQVAALRALNWLPLALVVVIALAFLF